MDARLATRSPVPQPEHSDRAGPPGPKQRVALLQLTQLRRPILCGFVIEEIGRQRSHNEARRTSNPSTAHHAANGVFRRAERALLKPMLRWSGRGLAHN